MGMDSLSLVTRVDNNMSKDQITSILVKSTNYQIENGPFAKLSIVSGAHVCLPDAFEIELDEDKAPQEFLTDVINTINNISIKLNTMTHCPYCGTALCFINGHTMCTNLDCLVSDDIESALRVKLILIVPSFPIKNIIKLVRLVREADLPLTVSSVIEFCIRNIDDRYCEDSLLKLCEDFITAIVDLTPTNLIQAIIGIPFPPEISKSIKYYNNKLISMIKDANEMFVVLHTQDISTDTRIWLTSVIMVNKSILNYVMTI